ncbi:putative aldouronate transport system substrate-binding protein [Cohnella sp. OV330]|uniref:ABC transporter substrate-binding protein n=1 Tax=Cohnella sp. OV330 TaxID=1855288 RepID=UPI0008DFDEC5|nr:ABC transporter substrate-binding protein [Cohnella sp. OV330]SFB10080.1 putative aldouronate transport system substrate-binding protein [Cohnella sp. OV330]
MSPTNLKKAKWLGTSTSAMLAAAIIVSGCSSKEEGSSSPSASSSAGESASPSASPSGSTPASQPADTGGDTKDFVKLSWYMPKPIDNMKDQADVEAEANKIIKEKLNAELHLNLIDNAGWEDKMKLISAAGEPYDIVFSTFSSNRISDNVQKGAFLPLDELLQKYGQNILAKVDPRAWKAVTYKGKIMAIPAQTPYAPAGAHVFKKDMVEKYKFDYKSVKSIKDLEPFLAEIKKNEPNMIPLLATANGTAAGVSLYDYTTITPGISYSEKDGKIVKILDVPENKENYRTINDFYKKGYIAKDAAIKTDYLAEAKSGKYAVMRDSGGYTEDGSKSTATYGFPTVETLAGYPTISTNSMTSAATAISATSKNPERAMMLLNEIWGDKYLLNTLAYGVEGKNYTVKSGTVKDDNPTIEATTGADQTWAIWHNWLGPLWDQWDSNWNSTAALEAMKKNNDNGKASGILGFIFNSEPVKTEIAQVSAIQKESNPILTTGSMPDFEKYYTDLQQRLNEAGMDKIMAEAQKQFDAWKAENS